jgi:monoamine oxidase
MHDIVILGGGISGLYLAYKLLKSGAKDIFIIEQNPTRLGGRIYTYKDKTMTVEAGAGRIHQSHIITLSLIRELEFGKNLVEIDNDSSFVSNQQRVSEENHVPSPYRSIVSRIIREARKRTKRELVSKTLFEFIVEVLGESSAKLAMDSFGYTTEFTHMNAYDAIELMRIISPHQKYYVLSGGLSQIVDELETRIREMGGVIRKGQQVYSIRRVSDQYYEIHCDYGVSYQAVQCICTVPAKNVGAIRFLGDAHFREEIGQWKHAIKASIYSGSLCRIYSRVEPSSVDLLQGKRTLHNDLRMIIPIESNLAMISYSDGPIANRWAKLFSEEGIRAINERLKFLIQRDMGVRLESLKHTRVFYWSNGVGYWKVGADSSSIEKRSTNGFSGLYFCGENYSSHNQQWVEGALDTAELVLARLQK